MCISCPAKVIRAENQFADVMDALGRRRQVKNPFGAKPGDCILIGMGYAMQVIPPEEYEKSADAYRKGMQ